VNADGKPMVHVLPTGDIQISKEMMQEERGLINDAFLVTLFQILTETPQMTATEVIERTNEKGILLAPTVGRQQRVSRPDDRPRARPAGRPGPAAADAAAAAGGAGEYQVVYTSPLARAQRAQEAAGFVRTVETVRELVNVTQDPSLLDRFDFDTAIPEIAADPVGAGALDGRRRHGCGQAQGPRAAAGEAAGRSRPRRRRPP
jgi:hypothetical protein